MHCCPEHRYKHSCECPVAGEVPNLLVDTDDVGCNLGKYPTALHCTALSRTALHCTARHCTALHCTADDAHHTALHCTALHCAALRCTALHCTEPLTTCASSCKDTTVDSTTTTAWYLRKESEETDLAGPALVTIPYRTIPHHLISDMCVCIAGKSCYCSPPGRQAAVTALGEGTAAAAAGGMPRQSHSSSPYIHSVRTASAQHSISTRTRTRTRTRTAQHSTAQHSISISTAQHSTAQHQHTHSIIDSDDDRTVVAVAVYL
jgi:hypothetical protein